MLLVLLGFRLFLSKQCIHKTAFQRSDSCLLDKILRVKSHCLSVQRTEMRAYFPLIWYLINPNSQYPDFCNSFSHNPRYPGFIACFFSLCFIYKFAMTPNTPSELTVHITIVLPPNRSLLFASLSVSVKKHNLPKTIENIKFQAGVPSTKYSCAQYAFACLPSVWDDCLQGLPKHLITL